MSNFDGFFYFVIHIREVKKTLENFDYICFVFIIDTPCLQSPTNSQLPMSLLRSVTVAGDQAPSITEHSFQYHGDNTVDQSSASETNEPKLRTFHGWKRNTAQLDKSRLSKSLWSTHVSVFFKLENLFFKQFI